LAPASSLPLELTFSSAGTTVESWSQETIGWAHTGIDFNQKGVIRYGTVTPTFIVGFTESPKDVSYDLQVVGAALSEGNEFKVEASSDGISWRNIKSFTHAGEIVQQPAWTSTISPLKASDRYVRWQYVTRTNNLNLNNIVVSKAEGDKIGLQVAVPALYQSAAGEITFTRPVAKVEAYNLLGAKTAVYNNPQGTISIADGVKGVTLVRVALKDGSTITQKVVK
jgi:hypothetical protein